MKTFHAKAPGSKDAKNFLRDRVIENLCSFASLRLLARKAQARGCVKSSDLDKEI
ncbi:MAG: hypothetical protein JWQ30_1482 [Sediminibacterium sp.]|nr:hypothetical protein [Sediminibacterium sp.]